MRFYSFTNYSEINGNSCYEKFPMYMDLKTLLIALKLRTSRAESTVKDKRICPHSHAQLVINDCTLESEILTGLNTLHSAHGHVQIQKLI